jgi:3-oxoadipate enol-lactonase
MPFAEFSDIRIHYDMTGPISAPALVLSNSLGTNFSMWDPQMATLTKNMRVLRYDTRGHGQSSVTAGPYTIEQLARDVVGLAEALKVERFSFCGLSMGGMIGMWLGIHAAERLNKLVLCSTAAKIGTPENWNSRIKTVREKGMQSISSAVVERWFTAGFRQRAAEVVERTKRIIEETSPEGYAACCEALRDADFRDSIATIRTPTLVISGTHDPATTPSDGHFLAERMAEARYVELNAAHLSNIEDAEHFTAELSKFLTD